MLYVPKRWYFISNIKVVPLMVNPFLQDYTLLTPRKDVKVLQTILNYLNIWDLLIIWCGQKILQFWSSSFAYLWYSNPLNTRQITKLDWYVRQNVRRNIKKSYHRPAWDASEMAFTVLWANYLTSKRLLVLVRIQASASPTVRRTCKRAERILNPISLPPPWDVRKHPL